MAARTRMVQLALPAPRTRGGRRKGAGRKRVGRRRTPHLARPTHNARHPVHITLRARQGLPSLRGSGICQVVKDALAASSKDWFRVLEFSVQRDHVHLIAEADNTACLSSGARGLSVRVAFAINKALGRTGGVWGDRYHARPLKTPMEVRNAKIYVLMNVKKHQPDLVPGVDPCSTGTSFRGFRDAA